VAKSVVGNHGGGPGVSKPSKGNAMDFESLGELGTGQESWGQNPRSSKRRGLGSRVEASWGKAWV
jgi:hypothetical protein